MKIDLLVIKSGAGAWSSSVPAHLAKSDDSWSLCEWKNDYQMDRVERTPENVAEYVTKRRKDICRLCLKIEDDILYPKTRTPKEHLSRAQTVKNRKQNQAADRLAMWKELVEATNAEKSNR